MSQIPGPVSTCTQAHARTQACMHASTRTHAGTCMHAGTHTHTGTHTHAGTRMHAGTCTHAGTHAHRHTHAHGHAHTYPHSAAGGRAESTVYHTARRQTPGSVSSFFRVMTASRTPDLLCSPLPLLSLVTFCTRILRLGLCEVLRVEGEGAAGLRTSPITSLLTSVLL